MDYFDWEYYINRYEDLKNAGILNEAKAKRHWIRFGMKENRICNKIFEDIDIKKYALENKLNDYYNNFNLKNNYNLENKKIMFISSDISWDMCWGNSIWARCFVSLIKKKYNCEITVFECRRCINGTDNIYKNELFDINFINLFENNKLSYITDETKKIISINDIIKLIKTEQENFDYIIVRGIIIMNKLITNCDNILLNKLIYVVIDRPQENIFLNKLQNIIHMTFIKYIKDKEISDIPQYIIPPLIIDDNIYKTQYSLINTEYDICIVGTLHEASNLNNILNIVKLFPNIKIIIAGKILNNYLKEMNKIKLKFDRYKNIIFNVSIDGITEEDSHKIILNSKIGMRFDLPVECLSSKVMNYICFNRLLIVQDIETHKYILTKDYPFFINKNDLLCTKLSFILENMTEDKIELAKELINNAKNKLNPDTLLKNNFSL